MSLVPDDIYQSAQDAFNGAEPIVTQYRAHAFDLIQNRTDMDDVETKLDLMHHIYMVVQQAPDQVSGISFLMAIAGEALHQLGMADHAAFAVMLGEIQNLPESTNL